MISLTTSTVAATPGLAPRRSIFERGTGAPQPSVALPSLADVRDARRSQLKEMAARKVQAVRERMDALKLMVKLDPKAALKMTAELARELRAAVRDYVDAGGKNPTHGDLKMAMRQAEAAREASDLAEARVPDAPGADPADAETRRAHTAYAAAADFAESQDNLADRLEASVDLASADMGFFDQVRLALGDIKSAREKIKAEWAHPRKPSEDDWKVADHELAELERQIDLAPTGVAEPPQMAPASVTA